MTYTMTIREHEIAARREGKQIGDFSRMVSAIRVFRDSMSADMLMKGFHIDKNTLDKIIDMIDNYPEGQTELLRAVNNPENETDGFREVPFGRELYIEREDFMEVAPKKYFRMAIGQEVRLRYAYFVTAQSVEKDAEGNITCIHCTYDPATRGGDAPDGRKVKGTIHWVSAQHAVEAEVRLFDRLFAVEAPDDCPEGKTFLDNLNPDSLKVMNHCKLEPALLNVEPDKTSWPDGIARYQFERMGYFCVDKDSTPDHLVFNRTSTLKDSWKKNA